MFLKSVFSGGFYTLLFVEKQKWQSSFKAHIRGKKKKSWNHTAFNRVILSAPRSITSLQTFFWTASGSCCASLCGIVSGRWLCCPQITLEKCCRHLKEDSCGVLRRFQEKLSHYYFKVLLSQNASSKAIKGSSSDIPNCSVHKMRCSWKGKAVFPVAFTNAPQRHLLQQNAFCGLNFAFWVIQGHKLGYLKVEWPLIWVWKTREVHFCNSSIWNYCEIEASLGYGMRPRLKERIMNI